MKKILALSLLLGSSVMFVPSAEAKNSTAAENSGAEVAANAFPQRIWRGPQRVRAVTRTRIVRRGFRTFRETWEYRYFGNGRVKSRLISRIRVR